MSGRQEGWTAFLDALQGLIAKGVIAGVILMVLIQVAMLNPVARRFLNLTERLEGIPWGEYFGEYESASGMAVGDRTDAGQGDVGGLYGVSDGVAVTLHLVGLESLAQGRILRNGQAVSDFDYPSVTVELKAGDRLDIDLGRLSMPVRFRIGTVSPGVMSPREGDVYEAAAGQRRLSLGRLVLSPMVRTP